MQEQALPGPEQGGADQDPEESIGQHQVADDLPQQQADHQDLGEQQQQRQGIVPENDGIGAGQGGGDQPPADAVEAQCQQYGDPPQVNLGLREDGQGKDGAGKRRDEKKTEHSLTTTIKSLKSLVLYGNFVNVNRDNRLVNMGAG